MYYKFYGAAGADIRPADKRYEKISDPRMLYDMLSKLWCADTCAPRMRSGWTRGNKTLGQCSITAFLAQDIFGGRVYGTLREGGNYHCYNVVGDCVFDLTSEQFGSEKLCYGNDPEQFREVHFAKEEKRLRYEYLKNELDLLYQRIRQYKVLDIAEGDYGCEETPENGEIMCSITAEDENGEVCSLSLPDGMLRENGIEKNSVIALF